MTGPPVAACETGGVCGTTDAMIAATPTNTQDATVIAA